MKIVIPKIFLALLLSGVATFAHGQQSTVEIFAKNGLVRVTYSGKDVSVDRESKNILTKMDSISIISNKSFSIDTIQYFWSYTRFSSRISNGSGYCGAGSEDFIILFSINNNKLTYIDKFQAQSCLENFSIGVDSIKDINSHVTFSPETNDIEISQDQFKEENVTTKKIRLKAMPLQIETTIVETN